MGTLNSKQQAELDHQQKNLKKPYEIPLNTMAMGSFIFLASCDPEAPDEHWLAVEPKDVPEFAKDEATMGRLVGGDMCEWPDRGLWLRVEKYVEQQAPGNE